MGLYEGLLFSLGILPAILIFKYELNLLMIFNLVLPPILGIVGGYIGKVLRLKFDNES
jgi:hypothetical protein